MKRLTLCLAVVTVIQGVSQDDLDVKNRRVFKKYSGAVAAVRVNAKTASGIVVDSEGYVLTSSTIVKSKTSSASVIMPSGKRTKARVVAIDSTLQVAVLKIQPEYVTSTVSIGESSGIQAGDFCYTIADSFNSITTDGAPCFSAGVISAVYEIKSPKGTGSFKGKVLETTAAVNPGAEGGALLNEEGELVGMLTLQYHPARFNGVAIPVDAVKDWVVSTIDEDKFY